MIYTTVNREWEIFYRWKSYIQPTLRYGTDSYLQSSPGSCTWHNGILNLGIWVKEIRTRSNLQLTQLNKVLKSLESKKSIKSVKPVTDSKKKVYMLFDIKPDSSLTGGAWYSENDFETEFVDILGRQTLTFLQVYWQALLNSGIF